MSRPQSSHHRNEDEEDEEKDQVARGRKERARDNAEARMEVELGDQLNDHHEQSSHRDRAIKGQVFLERDEIVEEVLELLLLVRLHPQQVLLSEEVVVHGNRHPRLDRRAHAPEVDVQPDRGRNHE